MELYYPVAVVTLLCGLLLFTMALAVARTRNQTGILAPAMTGDPLLERTIRAHYNTIEWVPVFLPSMWMFALFWNVWWAAALGALWLVGRIVYFVGYRAESTKRYPGFLIQVVATFALLFGALFRIIYLWLV